MIMQIDLGNNRIGYTPPKDESPLMTEYGLSFQPMESYSSHLQMNPQKNLLSVEEFLLDFFLEFSNYLAPTRKYC